MNSVSLPIYGRVNGKSGQVVGHTLVSECDVPRLEGMELGRYKNLYVHVAYRIDGKRRVQPLHRYLMQPPEWMQVDHANHDTLDNRRSNLRIATPSQNAANRNKYKNNTTGFKGVFCRPGNRYQAKCQGKHLGMFGCPIEAARAYDLAAIERFGAFALLNFPAEARA